MDHGKIDKKTAKGLKELRRRIAKMQIPPSVRDKSLNIATWNIRDFGKKARKNISIHLIAEILNQFDLIAVTEVRRNLKDLARVMDILGPHWKVVFSDFIADWGGNWERVAYVYDMRAAVFTGLAAEVDGPREKNNKTGEYESLVSWWRKPYIVSFRAGSFDFMLLTAHIRWGDGEEDRITPLKLLADWVDERHKSDSVFDKDIIVMGDFNIPTLGSKAFKAITGKGLQMPESLKEIPGTNLAKVSRYDQILHLPKTAPSFSDHGGILDFYTGGWKRLFPELALPKDKDYTWQLSDHLPLYVQVNTDLEDQQLEQILNKP